MILLGSILALILAAMLVGGLFETIDAYLPEWASDLCGAIIWIIIICYGYALVQG